MEFLEKHIKFLNKLKELNLNLFNDITFLEKYKGNNTKFNVKTKHGVCKICPSSLLKGIHPTIRSAINKTEYFINQAKEIHKNKYNYSLVNYTNSSTKIKIMCPTHGVFEQVATSHLQGIGCYHCGCLTITQKNTVSEDEFIEKANIKHKNFYNYKDINYINSSTKIQITCKFHGIFEQTSRNHLFGQGCPKCGQENCGWSHSIWKKAGEQSTRFKSYKLYVIKCWNNDKSEEFYKVGKTFKSIKDRFGKRLPYNYEIFKIVEGNADYISLLEIKYKRILKKYHYVPNISFKGSAKECFKI